MKISFGLRCLVLWFAMPLGLLQVSFAQQAPQRLPVIAGRAVRQDIADRIEALGTLRANESVALTAVITETISTIKFEDGEAVEKGQVLVEMTSDEEHALLEEVQSRLDEAKRQYERVEPLRKGGSASAALVDERLRDYQTARAQVRVIRSRLADRLIVAPFSGRLGLRNISSGALVTPGDIIVTLDDTSVMKLDFTVPSVFLSAIKPGMEIIGRSRAYGERRFEGIVSSMDSRVDPSTRSIVVRAIVPNPSGELKPGMLMSVELRKDRRQGIVIPEEAVLAYGDAKFVFVIKDEQGRLRLEKREIVGGLREGGMLEVVSGLEAGDSIVVHGTSKVEAGQEVEVVSYHDGKSEVSEPLQDRIKGATR